MSEAFLQIGHDSLLPNPYLFVIHTQPEKRSSHWQTPSFQPNVEHSG